MRTLGSQLERYRGFGPGFNFVRIALAYSVVVWHTVAVAEGTAAGARVLPLWPAIFAILPMFFSLSGFLVTASALRLPLREYILNRAFRIVPAIGVDICLCALVVGPLFTNLALGSYFSDPLFFRYFLNIIGYISYQLPGVFLNNPDAGIVNGALWTVPFEIACYVVMSTMIWLGLVRKWHWAVGLAAAIVVVAALLYGLGIGTGQGLADKLARFAFLSKGASLVPSFLLGSGVYLLRDRLPYSPVLAGLIVLGLVGLGVFGDPALFDHPVFVGVMSFPLAYLVAFIGLTPIPMPKVLEHGDYSYGIYLYHYPILQCLQSVFGLTSWWGLALVSALPITLFAVMSWHWIEKPVLKMRRKFSLVGARLTEAK